MLGARGAQHIPNHEVGAGLKKEGVGVGGGGGGGGCGGGDAVVIVLIVVMVAKWWCW